MINPIMLNIINGIKPLTMVEYGVPSTIQPLNKFKPKGGVYMPIDKLATVIAPRCIGSMPISIATGKINGISTTMHEPGPINIPAIKNEIFTIIKKVIVEAPPRKFRNN